MDKKIISAFLYLLIFSGIVKSQNFGFGCLGLSGVFGGYSIQQFESNVLEDHLGEYFVGSGKDASSIDFSQLEGYRVGANIFRARFNNFFLTTKGYYQFMSKKDWVFANGEGSVRSDEFNLSLNHWGLGFDLGLPLLGFIDWKIIEGGVNFYDVDFDYQSLIDEGEEKIHYSTKDVLVGYYAGTGLIIHLIPNYLSLEGTAIYNFMNISQFEDKDNDIFGLTTSEDKILEAKFGAAVQLNIGFPL